MTTRDTHTTENTQHPPRYVDGYADNQLIIVFRLVTIGVFGLNVDFFGRVPLGFRNGQPCKAPAAGVGSLPPRAAQGHRLQTFPVGFVVQSNSYLCSGKEVLFMSTEEKLIKTEQASKLARWFEISVKISIFGHVIFSKTWPPQE